MAYGVTEYSAGSWDVTLSGGVAVLTYHGHVGDGPDGVQEFIVAQEDIVDLIKVLQWADMEASA